MQNQHDHEQPSSSNDEIQFPNEQQYMSAISKTADSQPTKTKVTAFKNRVYKLIKLYTEKSQNLTPLLTSINQEIFMREPQKMNEIVLILINKMHDMGKQSVMKLMEIYKIMVLFKSQTCSRNVHDKILETFVRLLKKVIDQEGEKIIQQMIEKVFTKRNCKLNVTFFQFLARKIPTTKQIIVKCSTNLLKNKKLRPAQMKQLQKLKNKSIKHKPNPIKKQQPVQI